MGDRITQEELNRYMWKSAVILRSSIDAGSYKQYIFPLLFFKRCSDVYDEEIHNALIESDGDESVLEFEETHTVKIPDGCHWEDLRAFSEDIGPEIIKIFHNIETANGDKLLGVFGNAAWSNKNRLSDSVLKDLIEHFSSLDLSIKNCPEDEFGQGYEYLIKKFADDSGHTAQEFYTNRTVVHLMTELLQPQPGESIYDPTCGSAGMLISSVVHLKNKGKEWRNVRIYGQEINPLTTSMARMNVYLHGIKDFKIVNDDTLARPAFVENDTLQCFDMVLANPPYSINQWSRTAFEKDKYGRNMYGVPPQSRADYCFIQHIIKSMNKDSGRCAVLLPLGVLFRKEEQDIRTKMIESDVVECVIGLGSNLFYNSPMEACIIICRMNKPENEKGKILLINAIKEIVRKNAFSFLTDSHIDKISAAYNAFEDIEGFAKVVSLADVAAKDYSLNIPLYIDLPEDANETVEDCEFSVQDCFDVWKELSLETNDCYDMLSGMLVAEETMND